MSFSAVFDVLLIQNERRKAQDRTNSELWQQFYHIPGRITKWELKQARKQNNEAEEAILEHFNKKI